MTGNPRLELSPALAQHALDALFAAAWPGVGAPCPERLERHSLLWVAAFDAETLIGFANLAWDGGVHGFVLDPVVHPEHRRRGLGLALLSRLIEAARDRDLSCLHVDYEPALEEFYRQAGFRPTRAGLLRLQPG